MMISRHLGLKCTTASDRIPPFPMRSLAVQGTQGHEIDVAHIHDLVARSVRPLIDPRGNSAMTWRQLVGTNDPLLLGPLCRA